MILLGIGLLLLLPLVAMQFTNEVNWSPFDFLVMGLLLLGVGLTVELVLRNVRKVQLRMALLLAIAAGFFLIWAELSVGIFGTFWAGS